MGASIWKSRLTQSCNTPRKPFGAAAGLENEPDEMAIKRMTINEAELRLEFLREKQVFMEISEEEAQKRNAARQCDTSSSDSSCEE